jgi:hypothetical protein
MPFASCSGRRNPGQSDLKHGGGQVRTRPVFADVEVDLSFQLSSRFLVEVKGELDSMRTEERWRDLLRAANVRGKPDAGKRLVSITSVSNLRSEAKRIVGRVDKILGPLKTMKPTQASAYLHVLAMRWKPILGTCGSL